MKTKQLLEKIDTFLENCGGATGAATDQSQVPKSKCKGCGCMAKCTEGYCSKCNESVDEATKRVFYRQRLDTRTRGLTAGIHARRSLCLHCAKVKAHKHGQGYCANCFMKHGFKTLMRKANVRAAKARLPKKRKFHNK